MGANSTDEQEPPKISVTAAMRNLLERTPDLYPHTYVRLAIKNRAQYDRLIHDFGLLTRDVTYVGYSSDHGVIIVDALERDQDGRAVVGADGKVVSHRQRRRVAGFNDREKWA